MPAVSAQVFVFQSSPLEDNITALLSVSEFLPRKTRGFQTSKMSGMTLRQFEGMEHASIYQKYRLPLPLEIQSLVFNYLKEKKGKPFTLALDVGCGTGQCTRVLASHFEKVVGIDISEAQIKEAKKVSGPQNISYSVCPAEELPFEAASLDLILASSAVHWFNFEKFMKEADRVLKPRGCMALFTYTQHIEVHAKDCSDKLTAIFNEVEDILLEFRSVNITRLLSGYEEIFDAVPFTDKERVVDTIVAVPLSLEELLGFIQSFSMFQNFFRKDPEAAKELARKTEQRCLEALGTTSTQVMVEVHLQYMYVLACKSA